MLLTFILFIFLQTFYFTNAQCPDESLPWQNNCFFFHSNSTGFAFAEFNCSQIGGHLVSIHDGFTNALIAQSAENYFHDSTVTEFWIGLTTMVTGNNWIWMDNTELNFTEWSPNEPSNTTTGNNCAALSLANGLWKAEDCFKPKPYVCKVDKSFYEPPTTILTTTTQYPPYLNCSLPLVYFQPTHSCYGASMAGSVNWTLAEQQCLKFNGHLTSIHSYEELAFLEGFVYVASLYLWSGAFSNDGEKSWKWSDGTKWDYDHWFPDYPNLNTSACGLIGGGMGLNDFHCSDTYLFICKVQL